MAWLPDWSLPRYEIQIIHDDESYCSALEVEVAEEGVGLFRLYDFPYCEELRWGDLIRAVKYDIITVEGKCSLTFSASSRLVRLAEDSPTL